jgi:hypothetical protein
MERLRGVYIFLLAIAGALTLALAARTFWYLFHSITNVPYADQWAMLEEIWHRRTGQTGWSYLWRPYWGQRMLLPRLLFLFSVKYLHYAMLPFILINVAAQAAMVGALTGVCWRLFRDSRLLFWLAAVAIAHLLLSSLQMEVFIEGIEVQYTIGFASAVAAICVLGTALDPAVKFAPRFWIAVALALVSSLCLAVGPLTWPLLAVEAWLAGRRRYAAVLAAVAAVLAVAYSIGYTRPAIGMGISGIFHHPWQAFTVVGLVLGGPLSLYSRPLGMLAGCVGMALAAGMLIHAWRGRASRATAFSLMLVVLFMLGSAAAIAFGRISPEWLAGYSGQPLPSRYLAPTFVFWAALFAVALTCWLAAGIGRLAAGGVSLIVLLLSFGVWNWQWRMPREWAAVSQDYDAIASGFFMPVSDQEFMSRIFGPEELRTRLAAYMRDERLSVFAEPRANWLGQPVGAIAPARPNGSCQAAIRMAAPLGGNPPVFRIAGKLMLDGRSPARLLDVLMTDDSGTVIGLARTLPAQSEGAAATDFFGYARGWSQSARLLVLAGGRVTCEVAGMDEAR